MKSTIPLKYVTRTLRYLRPHKPLAIYSVILTGLTAVVALALPWPLAIIIDNVLGDKVHGPQPLPWWLHWIPVSISANPFSLITLAVSSGLVLLLILDALGNETAES